MRKVDDDFMRLPCGFLELVVDGLGAVALRVLEVFDYQSDRHCSKTQCASGSHPLGLITSQIDTAPKPEGVGAAAEGSLITSQIDTAPKRRGGSGGAASV